MFVVLVYACLGVGGFILVLCFLFSYPVSAFSLASMLLCLIHNLVSAEPISFVAPAKKILQISDDQKFVHASYNIHT